MKNSKENWYFGKRRKEDGVWHALHVYYVIHFGSKNREKSITLNSI